MYCIVNNLSVFIVVRFIHMKDQWFDKSLVLNKNVSILGEYFPQGLARVLSWSKIHFCSGTVINTQYRFEPKKSLKKKRIATFLS